MDTVMIAPSRGEEVEVLAKAKRRRFTLEYKRGILREAERCRQPGELGALLRREGLYSSHLSVWRAARERGELGGRGRHRRGPEPQPRDASANRAAQKERDPWPPTDQPPQGPGSRQPVYHLARWRAVGQLPQNASLIPK